MNLTNTKILSCIYKIQNKNNLNNLYSLAVLINPYKNTETVPWYSAGF